MFLANLYCLFFACCGLIIKKQASPNLAANKTPRIAIIAPLLLGDTLMSVSLIAKLRHLYPFSPILLICTQPLADLLRFGPYGIKTATIRLKSLSSMRAIRALGPFDLGYALGENRFALIAKAIGCSKVVALAGGRPFWRNMFVDQAVEIDQTSTNIYTQQAQLVGEPSSPLRFAKDEFSPLNKSVDRSLITKPHYVLLHLGSSRRSKQWASGNWRNLISALDSLGYRLVIAVGPGEQDLLQSVDPNSAHHAFVGGSNLEPFWGVVKDAAALVCVDSAAAHIGKLTETLTICFYGPGGEALTGPDQFFRQGRFFGLTLKSLPDKCREPVFKRTLPVRQTGTVLTDDAAIAETVRLLNSMRA
jgi:ADP-heptose:LPS heptosyltransferase